MAAAHKHATGGFRVVAAGTVVVVDDDPDICEALRDLIQAEGFSVRVAQNGVAALEVLREVEYPSLILLDMMMPVMDGWQFRREQAADAKLAKVPVVVLTAGNTAPWDVEDVILKPVSLDKLRRALKLARA